MSDRPKVTISNTTGRALVLRLHSPAAHEHAPRMPDGSDGVQLAAGGNAGIDKEWATAWFEQNKGSSLVESGTVTLIDEQPAE